MSWNNPVINDAEFRVWQQYSCRAWPTLMFIDPRGNVIGKHEGELSFEQFDTLMGGIVAEFDELGIMQRSPLPTIPPQGPVSNLSFPGKVLADEAGARLFIADTNHNRIVVSSFDGEVQQVIGSGEEAPYRRLAVPKLPSIIRRGWSSMATSCSLRTPRTTPSAG